MAQRRVSVRKAREILRLKFEAGLGNHKIGRACGVSASTVWDTVTRFQMTWNAPGLTEAPYLGFCESQKEGVRAHESFQVFA
jgi:hypothetical protein